MRLKSGLLKIVGHNVRDILNYKSTKPVEFLIASAMLLGGAVHLAMGDNLDKYAIYSVMRHYTSHPMVTIINLTLGGALMYSLLFQRVGIDSEARMYLPPEIADNFDDYIGDNRKFLTIRRNALMGIAGWCSCVAIWFFCAQPYAQIWVSPLLFSFQSVWAVFRIRRDEEVAIGRVRTYRRDNEHKMLCAQVTDIFKDLAGRARSAALSNTAGESGSLGRSHHNAAH